MVGPTKVVDTVEVKCSVVSVDVDANDEVVGGYSSGSVVGLDENIGVDNGELADVNSVVAGVVIVVMVSYVVSENRVDDEKRWVGGEEWCTKEVR